MKKYKIAQKQISDIKQDSNKKSKKHYKAKKGFASKSAEKVMRLDKNYTISFHQFKRRILSYLQEHGDFDAALLQRWIEKRAEKIAKKEKSKLHRIKTLFGRGREVQQSSADLKMLANIIEERRLGHDLTEVKKFKEIATLLQSGEELDLDTVIAFIEKHQETYLKEILDLNDVIRKIHTQQALQLEKRIKKILYIQEKKLLDDLFTGEALRAYTK